MGAVAEGSPSIRAQANLSALGLHEMAVGSIPVGSTKTTVKTVVFI